MLKKLVFVFAVAALAVGVGASSAQAYMFNTDLTLGSTGADVVALQDILVGAGHLAMPAGVAKGYFGALTQAAVAKWQTASGIAPAAGYVGPISRAKLNGTAVPTTGGLPAGCTSTAGFSSITGAKCDSGSALPAGCTSTAGFSVTTGAKCDGGSTATGPLAGTDGNISDASEIGTYNNEEVGDGEEGVKILGAEIEASNDGDISLRSVKVSFDPTGNTGSDNLDDYVDSVTIWLGDEEIGSASVDDFTENSDDTYSKTITVSGAKIDADDTARLYVSIDAVSNFDSGDISGDSWTVDVDSIRFEDGSGVVTTDDSTGDINAMNVPINFVSFSTAADTELKISTDSDSPEAGIVIVDTSDTTDDVVLLKGKLKLEGTSDVVVDEFPVTFTVTGTTGLASTTGSVTLVLGDEEYSESIDTSFNETVASVTFDNLDFAMDAGDTIEFEVRADIEGTDGDLDAGDTLTAAVTASNRDLMDVENEEGDQLADSTEKSGTASGEAQEFRTNGIMLTLVSTATDATTGTSVGDDIGLFTIKFKVTAIGDTVYVSSLADATTAANTDGKTSITVDRAGTATATNITVAIVNNTDTDLTSVGLYQIDEGESETFTVTASVPMNSGTVGQHRASLSGVRWTTDSTDATPSNSYTSNLDSFKTDYKVLN